MWNFIYFLFLVAILFFINLIVNEYFSKHTKAFKDLIVISLIQGVIINGILYGFQIINNFT